MNKNKFTEKLKQGVSVEQIETFARKYILEVFSALALLIGTISSAFNFFTGPGLTIVFTALGAFLGIFFPVPVEKGLKQLYGFAYKQEKTTQMVLGAVKLVVAIFIPFLLFGIIGLLAGTSHHYYIRQAQIAEGNKPHKNRGGASGEEHD